MEYKCSVCSATGCKLWRQYETFLEHLRLMCGPCALIDQEKKGPIDAEGRVSKKNDYLRTNQIGWLVPAVPTPDGTFWGYSSVPPEGVKWWRDLPSYPLTKAITSV